MSLYPSTGPTMELSPQLRLVLLAVLSELLQIGDDVVSLLLLMEAPKEHLRLGNQFLRRRQPLVQCSLIPGPAGLLTGDEPCGISVVWLRRPGAADNTVQRRSQPDRWLRPDRMA